MKSLLSEMPECSVIDYDTDLVTHGYINLTRLRIENDQLSLEKIYESFTVSVNIILVLKSFVACLRRLKLRAFQRLLQKLLGPL